MSIPLHASELRHATWKQGTSNGMSIEPNPDGISQWNIAFDVLLDHWVIGADVGVLWIDEQFLYVMGQHTSFAIPGHRLTAPLVFLPNEQTPLHRSYLLCLRTASGTGNLAIQFDVQNSGPPEHLALQTAFNACVRSSDREIEGQMPPITPFENAHQESQVIAALSKFIGARVGFLVVATVLILAISERMRLSAYATIPLLAGSAYLLLSDTWPQIWLAVRALKAMRSHKARLRRSQQAIR